MKKIINLVGKWTGANAIWEKVDGYKTKIGALALMLSAAADLLTRLAALPDFAALLKFAKALPADQSWLALVAGIAALGLGHKMEKSAGAEIKTEGK